MIGQLSFANARAAWLLPPLLLLLGLTLVERRRRQALLRAWGDHALVSRFSDLGAAWLLRLRPFVLFLALVAVVAALARPVLATRPGDDRRAPPDMVMLFDVSRSMGAEDYAPTLSRLGKAKAMVLDALSRLAGARVGIVTFAGAAFPQAPLTTDQTALRYVVSDWVFIESAPPGGSEVAQGIKTATKLFDGLKRERVILLFSDGGGADTESLGPALAEARANGIRIFTFGLGGPGSSRLPRYDGAGKFLGWLTVDGEIVTTTLDDRAMREIAAATGGAYSTVLTGRELRRTLDRLDVPRVPASGGTRDLFQWPLAAALVLLLLDRAGTALPAAWRWRRARGDPGRWLRDRRATS